MNPTVRIVFQKRMPDGAVRQSAPLYDSSSGRDRIVHAIEYARLLRTGCENGSLSSPSLCEMEPNHVMTAYVVTAHLERTHVEGSEESDEVHSDLSLDTMVLGYGDWLGNVRKVLSCCIDLDGSLSVDQLVIEDVPW